MKGGLELREVGRSQHCDRHLHFEVLPNVSRVDHRDIPALPGSHAFTAEPNLRLHTQAREPRTDTHPRRLVDRGDFAFDEVERYIGEQHPACAHGAGLPGHHDHRNATLARNIHRMQRPRAAEGKECELGKIVAALGRHRPDRTAHVGVGDPDNTVGCGLSRQAEGRSNTLGEGAPRQRLVHRHRALEQRHGIEAMQGDLRIGDGGLGPAAPIADRPWHGACAVRADLERPHFIEPGNAPPARADHVDVDHGRLDRVPRNGPVGRKDRLAVDDQGYVCAGTPHVERHEVPKPGDPAHLGRADHTGSRPREAGTNRKTANRLDRHQAAIGMYRERLHLDAHLRHPVKKPTQVELHAWPDRRVHRGRRQSLVLAELGKNLARNAYINIGHDFAHNVAGAPLMRWIAIGMQKTDRDRVDASVAQRKRRAAHIPLVQRLAHRPVCQQPFADFLAPHAGHQRGWFDDRVVIEMRAGLARQLQHIAKPAGGDQAAGRTLAFDDEIGRHGRSVADVANLARLDLMIEQ